MLKLIKWSIKTMLLLTGISSLFRCSSGYKEKDGKVFFNGKEISDKNFVVLSDEFAKDSSTVYYKDKAFGYADVTSFQVLDKKYAKDKNKAYYCDEYREGQNYYLTKKQTIVEVKQAIPASFESIGSGYAKDSRHAFFEGTAFNVKDISTFRSINIYFAKDDVQAYLNCLPIKGSNGKTFEMIDTYYAKDTAHIYYYEYSGNESHQICIIPCNRISFEVLSFPYSKDSRDVFYRGKKISGADASTFTALQHGYSKDKSAVYFETERIPAANAATFEIFKEDESSVEAFHFAKDNSAVFLDNKRINAANVVAFKILTLGYSTDNKQVFYKTDIVKDASPLSFKTYPHGYGDIDAADAKNKYLEGKKVNEQ